MEASISRRWARAVAGLSVMIAASVLAPVIHAQNEKPMPGGRVNPLPGESSTSAEQALQLSEVTPWISGRYRLTPSDVLELKFPYVPGFDQTLTVQPDGYVSLKALGDVRVQGRTLPELQALLAEGYAEILKKPVVNITLKEFEKPYFLVTGEVGHPGKFELRGATTLTQALVIAGGHKWSSKHSQVLLFRRFMSEWLEVKEYDVKKMFKSRNLSEDPLLRPGDTILVPKNTLAHIAPYISRPSLGLYLNPFAF